MNLTNVQTFVLLGFSFPKILAFLMFFLLLLTYLTTMAGNILILTLVLMNQRLHDPMYFFLSNLAILDIFFTNTTVLTLLRGFLPGVLTISLSTCIAQSFVYFLTGTAEFILFAVMSFDRYLAICYPLYYKIIMHKQMCYRFIAGVWIGSFFPLFPTTILVMRLKFCFNEINHFFCDIGPLLVNSCIKTTSIEMLIIINSSIMLISFIVTVKSYVSIGLAISRIKSTEGREKAFSTCSSHAIVVTMVYGSCILMYTRPVGGNVLDFNKKLSILNTVVVPLINPYVYTLRNQKVQEILIWILRV